MILDQAALLFRMAHLMASPAFPRSSSEEASILHKAGWSNATAKRCIASADLLHTSTLAVLARKRIGQRSPL
jgi:hypothetical protein